ncbi:unnamed protein product [Cyclocybe aegerita]|uniref:O-methyltransferase C-terminal domain-containing protein n=1 Tax=Cyclocybe aegerita TaxID=1973307 RepID=A0A8S0WZ85_CYCAE|nr:unnamed protein product [Cyclocybe aegerita]
MTLAVLRSLHAIIGDAIDDIERVYSTHGYTMDPSAPQSQEEDQQSSNQAPGPENDNPIPKPGHKSSTSTSHAYASPPPSPALATSPHYFLHSTTSQTAHNIDFPSLDAPCDPTSLSEQLTSHPTVGAAISRIAAAAGQLAATVQVPFLTICDSVMGYHLPSCMRLLEASHVAEILHEAGPEGLHVQAISDKNGVSASKLAHTLRLLATHHILREVSPDVFALNRISSLVYSGKTFAELQGYQSEGRPELKYSETNGIAAFVGLCSDECYKSSAYMTEAYFLSPSKETREGSDPAKAPFCFAFDTVKSGTGFFGWLEGDADFAGFGSRKATDVDDSIETGKGAILPPTPISATFGRKSPKTPKTPITPDRPPRPRRDTLRSQPGLTPSLRRQSSHPSPSSPTDPLSPPRPRIETDLPRLQRASETNVDTNSNRFRLARFGKAMTGTDGWEVPGAVLNGFDWHSLPHGSVVVDVGGGIGSTSMLLATAFSSPSGEDDGLGLKFVIQDRPVVCEMGEKAWKAKCPELLESTARFQVHDFFTPQPIKDAAVFLLRVVLHDWPDDFARRILFHLREAATPDTKLLIADFVLPLACPDIVGPTDGKEDCLEGIEGVESILAPSPLLPNLGKASANVYWMDMTMQVMFNAQERTLRETVALARSAGWKVVKVTKATGSLFGHIVAVPVDIPPETIEEQRAVILPSIDSFGAPSSPTSPAEDAISQPGPSSTSVLKDRREEMEHSVKAKRYCSDMEMAGRASSRCGTPTFGSRMRLSSAEEALSRFGGGVGRSRGTNRNISTPFGSTFGHPPPPPPSLLKPALSLFSSLSVGKSVKKKPSPLSVPPLQTSPPSPFARSPSHARKRSLASSPGDDHATGQSSSPSQVQASPRIITRRVSLANLRPSQNQSQETAIPPPPPLAGRHPPPSPLSPRHLGSPPPLPQTPSRSLARRASYAHLSISNASGIAPVAQIKPTLIPATRSSITVSVPLLGQGGARSTTNSPPRLSPSSSVANRQMPSATAHRFARRASHAQFPQIPLRKRSGTVVGPAEPPPRPPRHCERQKQTSISSLSGLSSPSSRNSSISGRMSSASGSSFGAVLGFHGIASATAGEERVASRSPISQAGADGDAGKVDTNPVLQGSEAIHLAEDADESDAEEPRNINPLLPSDHHCANTGVSTKTLAIIESNRSVDGAEELAASLLSAALANPEAVDSLVVPIVQIKPQANTILVTDEDAGYTDTPFFHLVEIRLSEGLGDELHETQLNKAKQTAVESSNSVLSAALFSASVLQNGLLSSKTIYAFARQGLQLPDEKSEDERKEIVAIGTLLQLLVAGKILVEKQLGLGFGLDKIVAALEVLKANKTIQNAKGVDLLEKTVTASKIGFSDPLSPANTWKALFPSSQSDDNPPCFLFLLDEIVPTPNLEPSFLILSPHKPSRSIVSPTTTRMPTDANLTFARLDW